MLTAPEITVEDPYAMSMSDGVNSYDFGSTPQGTPLLATFTIRNEGEDTLTVGSIHLPTGFSLASSPAVSVEPWGTTSFEVQLDASAPGTYGGSVSFANNDSDENPYDFSISGAVSALSPDIEVFDPWFGSIDDGYGTAYFDPTPVGSPVTRVDLPPFSSPGL